MRRFTNSSLLAGLDHRFFPPIVLILSFIIKVSAGLYMLDEIPRTYGWYEIASNLLAGNGTLLEYSFPVNSGESLLELRYYLVRPPVFLAFYLVNISWFSESVVFYVLMQSLFSIVYCWLAFLLFKLRFTSRIASIGLVIFAFYPYFISKIFNASEDNLYLIFILGSLYFLYLSLGSGKVKHFLFSSVLLGFAYLTRSTILFFFLLLVPYLLFFCRKVPPGRLLLYALVFLIILSPMLVYGYSIYQKPVLGDHSGSRFWVANNRYILPLYPGTSVDLIEKQLFFELNEEEVSTLEGMGRLEKEKYLNNKAYDYIRENPVNFLLAGFKKALNVFTPLYNPYAEGKNMLIRQLVHILFYWPLLAMGITGFIIRRKSLSHPDIIQILFYASLIAISVILWAHTRHTVVYHLSLLWGALLLFDKGSENTAQ